jgi:hypothetical protein
MFANDTDCFLKRGLFLTILTNEGYCSFLVIWIYEINQLVFGEQCNECVVVFSFLLEHIQLGKVLFKSLIKIMGNLVSKIQSSRSNSFQSDFFLVGMPFTP